MLCWTGGEINSSSFLIPQQLLPQPDEPIILLQTSRWITAQTPTNTKNTPYNTPKNMQSCKFSIFKPHRNQVNIDIPDLFSFPAGISPLGFLHFAGRIRVEFLTVSVSYLGYFLVN